MEHLAVNEHEAAVRWMAQQYGGLLTSLAEGLGGWRELGLALGRLAVQELEGRDAADGCPPRQRGATGRRGSFPPSGNTGGKSR